MDEQRHRISLGMKDSYIRDNVDIQQHSQKVPDEVIKENGFSDDTRLLTFPSSVLGAQNIDIEVESGECPILAQVESRASIPPLEVSLDEIDEPDMDNLVGRSQEHVDKTDTIHERNKRQAKKKAKEER